MNNIIIDPAQLALEMEKGVDINDGLVNVEQIIDREQGIDRTVLYFESGRIEDWDNVTDKLVSLTNPEAGRMK